MRVSIVHETVYRYADPATYSIQYLRLSPRSSPRQRVLSWKLYLPAPAQPWVDGFGNQAHVLVIDRPHKEIRIRAQGELEMQSDGHTVDDANEQAPDLFLRATRLTGADDAITTLAERQRVWLRRDADAALEDLMLAVRDRVDYRTGATESSTTAGEAFALGAGVCQDHAHVFVSCCRHLGIPARYVSGYLQTESDGRMASHAWAEAFLQGTGWRGFDISNRTRPGMHHVRLAVGLDYLDACPIRGFRRGGGEESMAVAVSVRDASAQQQQ